MTLKGFSCAVLLSAVIVISLSNFAMAADQDRKAAKKQAKMVKDMCFVMHQMKSDVMHKPDADVAYQSLDGLNIALPEKITIPLNLDVLAHAGMDVPAGLEGKANIANVDVYLDGRIMHEGKDISGDFDSLCAENKDKKKPTKPDDARSAIEKELFGE